MNRIHAHVLAEAEKYAQRAVKPVVAWDQLYAERWSAVCKNLADEVAAMDEEAGLSHLKMRRDDLKEGERRSWAVIGPRDAWLQMDQLVDAVAREHTGWIQVGRHGGLDNLVLSTRPGYQRMLGINRCVSSCGRERGESDEAWLARRDVWLAKYHPAIQVIRSRAAWSEDSQYTHIIGTVAQVRAVPHLVERELTEGMEMHCSKTITHSIEVVNAGPLGRQDGVEFLARAIAQGDEIPPAVGTIFDTGNGLCEIVA
jgi:hypothetical protein